MFEIVDEVENRDTIGESVDENTQCIFVGAFQALQMSYIPVSIEQVDPNEQRCAWFPACQEKESNVDANISNTSLTMMTLRSRLIKQNMALTRIESAFTWETWENSNTKEKKQIETEDICIIKNIHNII